MLSELPHLDLDVPQPPSTGRPTRYRNDPYCAAVLPKKVILPIASVDQVSSSSSSGGNSPSAGPIVFQLRHPATVSAVTADVEPQDEVPRRTNFAPSLAAIHKNSNDLRAADDRSFQPGDQPLPPGTLPLRHPSTRRSVPLPPVHFHHHHAPLANCGRGLAQQSSVAVSEMSVPVTSRPGFATRKKEIIARAVGFSDTDDVHLLTDDQQHSLVMPAIPSAAAQSSRQVLFAYVRFKHEVLCYKAIGFATLRSGDYLVVNADRGFNVGMVERVAVEGPSYPVLTSAVRLATVSEVMELTAIRLEERHVVDVVQDAANALNLPMSVVDVEFQFDRNKLTIFFQSDIVVDFRKLQRTLFKQFGCRIWLVLWRDVSASRH